MRRSGKRAGLNLFYSDSIHRDRSTCRLHPQAIDVGHLLFTGTCPAGAMFFPPLAMLTSGRVFYACFLQSCKASWFLYCQIVWGPRRAAVWLLAAIASELLDVMSRIETLDQCEAL